jgi:DNA-binding PadR family transcriptional regulator
MKGSSVWKGPLLAMLLDRPGHVYGLSSRLWRRLGPAWRTNPKDLYRLLEEAEELGLASSTEQESAVKGGAKDMRVYAPTAKTAAALDCWMERPLPKESFRSALTARMVLSREEHVPLLLHALSEYEEFLFDQSRKYDTPFPTDTYTGLERELARKAVVKRVEASLEWVEDARGMLNDFVASRHRA